MARGKTQTPAKHIPLLGAGLMIVATIFISMMDATVKFVMDDLPFAQVAFLRYAMMTLFLFPLIFATGKGRDIVQVKKPVAQILRGLLMFLSTFLFFGAIEFMPLADAVALSFVSPMLTTVLSGLFLKEQIGLRRYLAVFVGFIGVLIIVRPGTESFSLPTLMALGSGLSLAFFNILTRSVATEAPPLVALFYAGMTGSVIGVVFAQTVWVPVSSADYGLLALIGFLGMSGHGLLIMSFRYGEASFVAPFIYFEIVAATVFGYLLFGDFPALLVWVGVAIIVSSGFYIGWRERKRAQETAQDKGLRADAI